ncbi:MAG: hypothetical protein WCW29_04215 [Candidatus Paceibacterota bacterium]|jgi:heme A synthase
MNNEDIFQNNSDKTNTAFEFILAGLMLFGAIIAAITVYLYIFNPGAALAKRLPKVSTPNILDYLFMCLQIIIGVLTAISVFFFKKKVIVGFIIGLGINASAYFYQMLFRSTIERNISEYIIPYSMGPILIIIILVNLLRTKNNTI